MNRKEAVERYGEPDEMGHITRFSDSSMYDEICVMCGLVDGVGYTPKHSIYNTRCSHSPENPQ